MMPGAHVSKHFYQAADFSHFAKSSGLILKPTPLCISPWSKAFQYGGNVACALYTALSSQLTQLNSSNNNSTAEPFRICQFNMHFFKPVPMQPLFLTPASALRVGGKVVHLQASLMGSRSSGEPGEEICRASGVFMRQRDITSHGVTTTPNTRTQLDLSKPEQSLVTGAGEPPRIGGSLVKHYAEPGVGFFQGLDARVPVGGRDGKPVKFWTRLHTPLFEGQEIDPIHRMLLVGEGTNGITAFLPLKKFSFVNPTFNLTILRPPKSEWVCLRGRTEVCGETGAGIVVGSIYDEEDGSSPCATVSQTLLVEPWEHVQKKNPALQTPVRTGLVGKEGW